MFHVDEIWAFLSVDADNNEGIIGFSTNDGRWVPMVCADRKNIDPLRPLAKEIAAAAGKTVVLAHFSQRDDVELIS